MARDVGGAALDFRGMAEWWAAHWVEVLGFVTGAACVVLAWQRSMWTFPVGLVNTALFLWLFADAGLYADAGLQVVFMVLSVTGWVAWFRARRDEHDQHLSRDEAFVVRTPRAAVPVLLLAAVLGTVLLAWLLTQHTDSTAQVPDAATTTLSLVAQYMLNRRWLESWLVWITVDVAYVFLYLSRDLVITAVLYAGFIGVCAAAWLSWRRLPGAATVAPTHQEHEEHEEVGTRG